MTRNARVIHFQRAAAAHAADARADLERGYLHQAKLHQRYASQYAALARDTLEIEPGPVSAAMYTARHARAWFRENAQYAPAAAFDAVERLVVEAAHDVYCAQNRGVDELPPHTAGAAINYILDGGV